MFKIADEVAYEKYRFLELESVFKTKENTWRCETKCGNYLQVRVKYSMIHMALSETEHGLINENIVLNIGGIKEPNNLFDFDKISAKILSSIEIIEFGKIKDFMSWSCEEEQLWDL